MARSDYAHWNEEQDRVWWEEEGKHEREPEDRFDADEDWRDEPYEDDDDGE